MSGEMADPNAVEDAPPVVPDTNGADMIADIDEVVEAPPEEGWKSLFVKWRF